MNVIWIVDKTVVPHLLQQEGLLAELPLRVSYECAVESGAVVDGSLSIRVLYNGRSVSRRFPGMEEESLNAELGVTANHAVYEHLASNGIRGETQTVEAVVIAAH